MAGKRGGGEEGSGWEVSTIVMYNMYLYYGLLACTSSCPNMCGHDYTVNTV
jgi:hypothetical protein